MSIKNFEYGKALKRANKRAENSQAKTFSIRQSETIGNTTTTTSIKDISRVKAESHLYGNTNNSKNIGKIKNSVIGFLMRESHNNTLKHKENKPYLIKKFKSQAEQKTSQAKQSQAKPKTTSPSRAEPSPIQAEPSPLIAQAK